MPTIDQSNHTKNTTDAITHQSASTSPVPSSSPTLSLSPTMTSSPSLNVSSNVNTTDPVEKSSSASVKYIHMRTASILFITTSFMMI
mmetsp:Transcript_33501/g.50524  ORF Transcript_33501/g.50524 Transcript_33501/m.50524 type:complete len:87 (-) Transcript_33501:235-495(-)